MSEAQYGYLTTKTKSGIVNVSRITLGHGVMYNWHTQLIHRDKLYMITDQNIAYDNQDVIELDKFYKVWFNGCLIYSRPWWKFW